MPVLSLKMINFLTKDFIHEISEKVFEDGNTNPNDPLEYLMAFSKYLLEALEYEEIRPMIDNSLFQCQCLSWLGMSALQQGYCPSCTRPIRIAIGRPLHE